MCLLAKVSNRGANVAGATRLLVLAHLTHLGYDCAIAATLAAGRDVIDEVCDLAAPRVKVAW